MSFFFLTFYQNKFIESNFQAYNLLKLTKDIIMSYFLFENKICIYMNLFFLFGAMKGD